MNRNTFRAFTSYQQQPVAPHETDYAASRRILPRESVAQPASTVDDACTHVHTVAHGIVSEPWRYDATERRLMQEAGFDVPVYDPTATEAERTD